MSVATTDYLAAIEHLPFRAVLSFDDVSWEDYENLLADLGDSYRVRIFYDGGRMEIMAPASAHEKPKSDLNRLIIALGDGLDIDVESLASTTLKRQLKAQGAEPDDSFYVQNAALIIGKDNLDLEHDPPPDIVVEVDRTNSSLNKFRIYAALGVPEIWRVTSRKVQFYLLEDETYSESPQSGAFPILTVQTLSDFLELARTEGGRKACRAFRNWVSEHTQPDR